MQSKNPRKFFSLVILGFLSLTILLNFQNCGKARLYKMGESNSVITAQYNSLLPPPVSREATLRAVIIVDQSFSMKYGKCPTDLDGATPAGTPVACNPGPGVDPTNNRYKVIENWIRSLEISASGETNGSAIKIAILPMSGGQKERPNKDLNQNPKDSDMMDRFLTIAEAKTWVNYLKQEHDSEPPDGKKMGTTVPFTAIQKASSLLQREFTELERANMLDKAQFEIVFVSDGVMKPVQALLDEALRLAQCPRDCQPGCDKNPDPVSCTDPRPACVPDTGYSGGPSPFEYCTTTIPARFKASFGESSSNTIGGVSSAFTEILKLPETFGGGDMKLRLTQIHPERIPNDADQNSPSPNLFKKISETFANNPKVFSAIIDSSTPPFSIQPRNKGLVTYKIANFFVVNLNAYVDEYGSLSVDSDGDGLSDKQELVLGYSPTNPKTGKNSVGGRKCLDSIDSLYGCERQRPCDPSEDNDADGLSTCDEYTMRSSLEKSDSDGDGIFDFLESFRSGLNPNFNETSSFKSGDQFNDHQHFFRGVHPQVALGNLPDQQKVEHDVKFINLEKTQTLRGTIKISSVYSIQLKNLPLLNTLAVPEQPAMKYSRRNIQRNIPATDLIGPTGHAAGINQVLFFVKVTAIENKEDTYWLFSRKNIPVSQGDLGQIKLNLQDFTELQLLLN